LEAVLRTGGSGTWPPPAGWEAGGLAGGGAVGLAEAPDDGAVALLDGLVSAGALADVDPPFPTGAAGDAEDFEEAQPASTVNRAAAAVARTRFFMAWFSPCASEGVGFGRGGRLVGSPAFSRGF
jgi:hypothetical protein